MCKSRIPRTLYRKVTFPNATLPDVTTGVVKQGLDTHRVITSGVEHVQIPVMSLELIELKCKTIQRE